MHADSSSNARSVFPNARSIFPNARSVFPNARRHFELAAACTLPISGLKRPTYRTEVARPGYHPPTGIKRNVRPLSHTAPMPSIASELQHHLRHWQQLSLEQKQRQVAQQKLDGRCNITPMPRVATQPFRTELYTDGLPLFVSNSYRGGRRLVEWELTHPESGEPVRERLLVGCTFDDPTERGMLYQEHQEVWYQLMKRWNDDAYPVLTADNDAYGHVRLSAGELVRLLRSNDRSGRKYQRVRKLLRDLSQVPICREQYYQWQEKRNRVEFTLLAGVEWRGREINPATGVPYASGQSEVKILFSSFVTERFLEHDIKPLLLQPYLELAGKRTGRRSQIAALLYPRLDRELATKNEYHRKLRPLMAELGTREYRYKSQRLSKMRPAAHALTGTLIQNEQYILHVTLREAADGEDYVLVAQRKPLTRRS